MAVKLAWHADVTCDRALPFAARTVASYLLHHVSFHEGVAWPSQQAIADDLKLKVDSVRMLINRLVKRGWLLKFRQRRSATNRYVLARSSTISNAVAAVKADAKAARSITRLRHRTEAWVSVGPIPTYRSDRNVGIAYSFNRNLGDDSNLGVIDREDLGGVAISLVARLAARSAA